MANRLIREQFTSNNTWVCPSGITLIDVLMIGAGGGGGGGAGGGSGASASPTQGGGGGRLAAGSVGLFADCGEPGEILVLRNVPVIPGTSYPIVVNTGGLGGAGGPGGAAQTTPNTAGNNGSPGLDGGTAGYSAFGAIQVAGGRGGSGCANVPLGGLINTQTSGAVGLNGTAFQSLTSDDRAGLGLGFPSGEWSTHAFKLLNFLGGSSGSAGSGSAPGGSSAGGGGGASGNGANLASLYAVIGYVASPNTQISIPSGSRGGHGSAGAAVSGSGLPGGNAPAGQAWSLGYGSGGTAGANGGGSGGGAAPNGTSAIAGQGSNGQNGQAGIVIITYVD